MATIIRMRELGTADQKVGNTYDGRVKMKTVITEGFYGSGRTRAILEEVVPVHTECSICKVYLSKYEEKMAPYMIHCSHRSVVPIKDIRADRCIDCHRVFVDKSDKLKPEYICFECFKDMIGYESFRDIVDKR
jgi:hypothetical protein